MEPRLIQQQAQKLILSPQIRQYLRLLQLPLTALQQEIDLEISQNPLLEEKPRIAGEDESPPPGPSPDSKDHPVDELTLGESYKGFREMAGEFFNSEIDPSRRSSDELQKQKDFQESLLTKPEGLSDFLMWQIRFLDLSKKELKTAQEIIGNIDETGYLKATLDDIANAQGVDTGFVESVLHQIHQLDPPGIGARDLQEALLIQLQKRGEESSLAYQIVKNHIGLLSKRNWKQIAKLLTASVDDIKNAADMIGRLEPRPGRTLYTEEPIAITPDATVTADGDSKERYKIEIHGERLPELRLNPYYRRLLRDKNTDAKTRIFLREKMQSALNFMRALGLRKSTIHEITEEILRAQKDFFEKGFAHLKPLRLKDIAVKVGIHESTVSRALQGKYIATPQGVIPYRSFFSSKLDTTEGEAESQKSTMERIRNIIEKENPKTPLSDQAIVKQLKNECLLIARRTVAKYRELLKILPSHLRRRQ